MREQPVHDEKRWGEHPAQIVAQHRCRRLKLGEPGKLASEFLIRVAWRCSIGRHAAGCLSLLESQLASNLQGVRRSSQAEMHSFVEARTPNLGVTAN